MPRDETPSNDEGAKRSITAFLTDGSLSRLCEELSRLVGIDVQLRDENSDLIVPAAGDIPWKIDRSAGPVASGSDLLPIVVDSQTIGTLVVAPGGSEEQRQTLIAAIADLAAASGEVCRHVVELEHRVKAMDMLHELTTLLVGAQGVEHVLQIALDSALDVFELDAGSIVLFRDEGGPAAGESEADLLLKASHGLSEEWLTSDQALSKSRTFDRLALGGEIVAVQDLLEDDRVRIRERVINEGVRSFVTAGMVFRDEPIGVIRLYGRTPRSFSEAEKQLLSSIGQQAALAVEQARLLDMQRRERRMQAQLKIASDVQRRMLPEHAPSIAGVDVAARYVPSLQLSGDFYDLFEHDGRLVVALGDVVGKGVPAALLMASIRTSLRIHVDREANIADAMELVNKGLFRDTQDNEFATLWCGAINRKAGRIRYVSAGHDPVLLRRSDGLIEELPTGGLVIGLDPEQQYESVDVPFTSGDTLVVYSDGVTDAMNFDGKRFKRGRLRDAISAAFDSDPKASPKAVLERIRWELRQFRGLNAQTDDETLVVVRLADEPSI